MWPGRARRGYRQPNMGLLLLFIQLAQAGFDKIPAVTLGTISLNAAVYLGVFHTITNRHYPHPTQVCAGVLQVWYKRDYWRIISATFHHADDWHLYYNMVSFLWKGMNLERRIGSSRFLYMVSLFSILVNIVMLYLNYGLAVLFNDMSYIRECAVGFSGVVFAIKVVTTQLMPRGTTMFLGLFPVNTRISCWFELLLIQIIVPSASFTGHLAGILVGLAYANDSLRKVLEWPLYGATRRRSFGPSYTYHRGTATYAPPSRPYEYEEFTRFTGGMDEQEQMRMATERSLMDHPRSNYERLYPDLQTDMSNGVTPSAPPQSFNDPLDGDTNGAVMPSAPAEAPNEPPPYGWNIPQAKANDADHQETTVEDINVEQVRRRRLERFTNT